MSNAWVQDNDGAYTLSGNDRIAALATDVGPVGPNGIVSSNEISSGKVYQEIKITCTILYLGVIGIGVGSITQTQIESDFNITAYPDSTNAFVGCYFDVRKGFYAYPNLSTLAQDIGYDGGVFASNSILMLAYDAATGDLWVGMDGTWYGGDPAVDAASYNLSGLLTDNTCRVFAESDYDDHIFEFVDDSSLQWQPTGFVTVGQLYRWPPSNVVGISKVKDRDGNPVSWPVYLMRESTKEPVQSVTSSNVDGAYWFSGLSDGGPYFAMVTPTVSGYRYLTTGEAGSPISAEPGEYDPIPQNP